MSQQFSIQLFSQVRIRSLWDSVTEEWYFSVVDVIGALTDSKDPRNYWKVLKNRLKKEGNQTVTNCNRFKLPASDGRMRLTDMATSSQVLRITQSVPSPKAEPLKVWMAEIAATRLAQAKDPELSIQQAVLDYKRLGYSAPWINQRIKSIEVRNELTNEWQRSGVNGQQYAYLTDIITQGWSGLTTREYKNYKGLHKENLRDNMTNVELAINTLAEAATTELSKQHNPRTLDQNIRTAGEGGKVAKAAKDELEKR